MIWRLSLNFIKVMPLVVCTALFGACAAQTQIDRRPTAIALKLNEGVSDKLEEDRHRYLVKVLSEGSLKVDLSWNNQDGIDRVIFQGGRIPVRTMLARARQKLVMETRVAPGFYYIELVPGDASTSYNLLVGLSR